MTIDYGNDVTCHAVPVILFLFPLKNNFTPQMEKEETNSTNGEKLQTVNWCLKMQR